jgi:CRP/FNR family transcriptional regulator, cyclic AMP receptor protein
MSAHEESLRAASAEGTFLGQLPADARASLVADGAILEVRRGQTIFPSTESRDRVGIVLSGTARAHITAGNGRWLTTRYARAGAIVRSMTLDRATLAVQAVSDCVVIEIKLATLQSLIVADGRVGSVLLTEVFERLKDTYATLASNTFGSIRERVARLLLDLSIEERADAGLSVTITQQGLADGVGSVREVVARTLREFRDEGLIATRPGHIQILDEGRLAGIIGRYPVDPA